MDCPEAVGQVTVEQPVCLECETPSTLFEHATMHSDGVALGTELLLSPEIPTNGPGITNHSGTESLPVPAAASAKSPTNDTPPLPPLEGSVPTPSSSEMKGKSKALPSSSAVQTTSAHGIVPPSPPSKLPPAAKGPSSNQPPLSPQLWAKFSILLGILKEARAKGCLHVSRSDLGTRLHQHRVKHFKTYVAEAERAGIVELGGKGNEMWVSLHRNWW